MSVNTGLRLNPVLRREAREKLKGNWMYPVLVTLLFSVVSSALSWIPFLGAIVTIVISGPLMYGFAKFFIKLYRGEDAVIEHLFDGFKLFSPTFVLYLLVFIFYLLWSLLFIVPGIIAALRYSMAFFVLYDNPGITPREALNRSKTMMRGHCGQLFLLFLSFFGWALLACLTCGIGFLWLTPYIQTSVVGFYEDLKSITSPARAEGPVTTSI